MDDCVFTFNIYIIDFLHINISACRFVLMDLIIVVVFHLSSFYLDALSPKKIISGTNITIRLIIVTRLLQILLYSH